MKTCTICKTEKDLDQFHKHPHTRDKRQSWCKPCAVAYHNNRNKTKRENWRKYQYKFNYGITIDDYERMLDEQNGACAICKNPADGSALHVDHCHETAKVRGLLCKKCNLGLGFFKDSPHLLNSAAEYLGKTKIT